MAETLGGDTVMSAMEERILFVDDDPNILETYQRKLGRVLRVFTAQGPHVGLRTLQEKGPFAVVVSDMKMPLMNGIEFLKKVKEISPNTVRIMLTGNADINDAMEAVNEGAIFRFLLKPCPSEIFAKSLIAAIEQYRLVVAERELLERTLTGMVAMLTEILSWTRPEIFGLVMNLRGFARSIASRMNVENLWELELAATLCPIGYLALPHEIVHKKERGEPLTEEETRSLESVPSIGHDLIVNIPRMERVAKVVLYHDKRYDGSGYPPDNVAGEAIPLNSRILKVALDYTRLRESGRPRFECVQEMKQRTGWYDPAVLEALGAGSAEAPRREVRVAQVYACDLKPGMTLADPIVTDSGLKLMSAGTVLTEPMLVRFRKYLETNRVKEPIVIRLPDSE
ncbi:MAG TPA: HD domain-containing phosphohydrolase [Candidatus Hydrogenedentes bacterium]|nr:HD domain-containing phosphohydrolase [Candidatus Hydrogenedentota bacterium]